MLLLYFLGPKVVFLPKICCTKLSDFNYGEGRSPENKILCRVTYIKALN